MDFAMVKRPTALMLGAGALALAVGAANAAPLVKDCGKNGNYVIGFSQANNAEPYRQHVNDELTAAAKKVPQFTLQIADGAGNVNTQTSQMDNFITQKVDLILISPFEAAPLTPVVARAMKAGIPVIELDRKTVGDPGKDYTAFIGGDNFKIAQEAGKYVAGKLLPDGVMLELHYEDLVADLEPQARRLLAHCGLAWDAACLDFHQTARPVRTAAKASSKVGQGSGS